MRGLGQQASGTINVKHTKKAKLTKHAHLILTSYHPTMKAPLLGVITLLLVSVDYSSARAHEALRSNKMMTIPKKGKGELASSGTDSSKEGKGVIKGEEEPQDFPPSKAKYMMKKTKKSSKKDKYKQTYHAPTPTTQTPCDPSIDLECDDVVPGQTEPTGESIPEPTNKPTPASASMPISPTLNPTGSSNSTTGPALPCDPEEDAECDDPLNGDDRN